MRQQESRALATGPGHRLWSLLPCHATPVDLVMVCLPLQLVWAPRGLSGGQGRPVAGERPPGGVVPHGAPFTAVTAPQSTQSVIAP